MRNLLLTLLTGTVVVAPLAAQDQAAMARGAGVYGDLCGRCHNARSPLERTDREWVTIINHMRVRANMTGRQTRDVLAFLQGTNTGPEEVLAAEPMAAIPVPRVEYTGAVATDPAVIARGDSLVAAKACLGCHVIGNAGGNLGPKLNDVVARRGPAWVRHKLADPTFNSATSLMPNFGLRPEEIEAITAYLASLRR